MREIPATVSLTTMPQAAIALGTAHKVTTMKHDLQHTTALLTRTPAVLNVLLRDLPQAWTSTDEGENTWSASDVVAHLIHTERTDWMTRARMVMTFGETCTFAPLDRWGDIRERQGKSLERSLEEFAVLRSQKLTELLHMNLQPQDLDRCGRHPALGIVTLSELLAAWAVHDLTHLHQLSRIMAHQYREAVGPFSKFLGVLNCNGHSAP